MNRDLNAVSQTARALRDAFDEEFARAPIARTATDGDYIGIRVGGDPYAVELAEIAGLFADRKIVPLPGRAPELLGVASLRGEIVPVYSLRAFLGYAPAEEPPRWLMLAGGKQVVSFAFGRFAGHLRIPHGQLSSVPGESARGYIQAAATVAGLRRSIISVRSIMDTIARRPLKEH